MEHITNDEAVEASALDLKRLREEYRKTTMKPWDRKYGFLKYLMKKSDFEFLLSAKSMTPVLLDEVEELHVKNAQLVDFMSRIQREFKTQMKSSEGATKGEPQEIDRAYDAVQFLASTLIDVAIPMLEHSESEMSKSGLDTHEFKLAIDEIKSSLN